MNKVKRAIGLCEESGCGCPIGLCARKGLQPGERAMRKQKGCGLTVRHRHGAALYEREDREID